MLSRSLLTKGKKSVFRFPSLMFSAFLPSRSTAALTLASCAIHSTGRPFLFGHRTTFLAKPAVFSSSRRPINCFNQAALFRSSHRLFWSRPFNRPFVRPPTRSHASTLRSCNAPKRWTSTQPKNVTDTQTNVGKGATSAVAQKKSLWVKVKEEAKHYWLGTKLLAKESKISTRLLWKLLKGISLTRREHSQLVRTAKDLFRLIPFAVFIIVPFMELLLPVALKLFPNMLPSTYSDKDKEELKRKQVMATKLQMAKFLRDSIKESKTVEKPTEEAATVAEFASFFKKYRTSGGRAGTEEVLDVCRRFSDDLTLDNLSRPQLVTLCRFMGVNAFGTDNFLRFVLRRQMRGISSDDRMIMAEGVDSLTVPELLAACQVRGIRTIDVYPDRLRYELQQWLDLHLKHEVPPTLLILSRALMMSDKPLEEDATEALQTTLTSLPNEVVEETELRLSDAEGTASIEQKLELIEKEEERIAKELADAALERDKQAKELEERAAIESELPNDVAVEQVNDDHLTSEQFKELEENLTAIAVDEDEGSERKQLEDLKLSRERFAMDHAAEGSKTTKKQLKELDDLIKEMEEYMNAMESERTRNLSDSISSDVKADVTTEQLEAALKMMRHPPDDQRIRKIVKRLDADGDGRVFLQEIISLANEVEELEKQQQDHPSQ